MNIIWITLESILPANSGGRLGVFKRIEQLSKTENIYLFYPYDDPMDLKYVDELKKYCVEVHPYYRKNNLLKKIMMLCKYPYTVASRNIHEMQEDIKKCIINNNIDLINVDFPHMCVNLLNLNINIPIILNEHNIEWKVYDTISKSQKSIVKKILYKIDSNRLRKFEERIIHDLKINRFTFVSSEDRKFMIDENLCNKKNSILVPVGADKRNIPKQNLNKLNKRIIFVGKMSYGPNVEAVNWFVKNCLVYIKNVIPNVEFVIVGKDPTKEVLDLESDSIVVTGLVDDVSQYYLEADLVVIPLKNGGGVKVKLLEAISYKKSIVSTSKGVEGTLYADGKFIYVSDNAEEFADFCLECLLMPNEKKKNDMYNLFLENYTWESICLNYLTEMKNIVMEKADE